MTNIALGSLVTNLIIKYFKYQASYMFAIVRFIFKQYHLLSASHRLSISSDVCYLLGRSKYGSASMCRIDTKCKRPAGSCSSSGEVSFTVKGKNQQIEI